ncbi:MAG: hypothetical protein J6U39_01875 [Clostridia bacterium]|nr:hypothetical protein [Clostridia bacterium]
MSEVTIKNIRKKERKWIRNNLIIGELLTFILCLFVYEVFGGARDLSAGGAIVAAVIISLITGVGTVIFAGPIVMSIREIDLYSIPDMIDKTDTYTDVRYLDDDLFWGVNKNDHGAEDFFTSRFSRKQKVTRWDFMKAFIFYYVVIFLALAAVIASWILIKRSGSVAHNEGNILYYDEDIMSIHENYGTLLALGINALVICGTLLLMRFVYLTKRSCSGCHALGSKVLESIVSSEYGKYDRTYTIEEKHYVGTEKERDEEFGLEGDEEEEVYVSVPRKVTDHYETYSAKYRCRCIYCGKEKDILHYSVNKK